MLRLTLLFGQAGHMVGPGSGDGDLCKTHARPAQPHAGSVEEGLTEPRLSAPKGMCEDQHGNLWVANTQAKNILHWDAETGEKALPDGW
jgi:sugar lactone lactonase YvrE